MLVEWLSVSSDPENVLERHSAGVRDLLDRLETLLARGDVAANELFVESENLLLKKFSDSRATARTTDRRLRLSGGLENCPVHALPVVIYNCRPPA